MNLYFTIWVKISAHLSIIFLVYCEKIRNSCNMKDKCILLMPFAYILTCES